MDFMEVMGKDVFLVADHVSSHVFGKITPDKSFSSAQSAMEEYFHLYSLPYQVQSDNGPAFRNKWLQWLESLHINCHFTSPYRSKSNGLIERNVGKVRAAIEKLGKLTKETLKKVIYDLNSTPHQDSSDSPNAKFLSRGVPSYLPNSVNREVDRRALIKRRQDIQMKLAAKKGYSSKDAFAIGDRVRIKNPLDGRWNKSGTIVEERPTGTTSPPASFVVKTDDGTELLRHKSYIKW